MNLIPEFNEGSIELLTSNSELLLIQHLSRYMQKIKYSLQTKK